MASRHQGHPGTKDIQTPRTPRHQGQGTREFSEGSFGGGGGGGGVSEEEYFWWMGIFHFSILGDG